MADMRKLREKLRPLIRGVGGATVLVAGLAASCSETTTSGNLIAPDVQQVDATPDQFTSGNLLPSDVVEYQDTGKSDTGTTDTGTTDTGTTDSTTIDAGKPDAVDSFTSGNLLPPDVGIADAATKTE